MDSLQHVDAGLCLLQGSGFSRVYGVIVVIVLRKLHVGFAGCFGLKGLWCR